MSTKTPVIDYLKTVKPEEVNPSFLAYILNLQEVSKVSPIISSAIVKELESQRTSLKLIASENYCSVPVQLAMGNLLTDKYAEGFSGHRFYAGCDNVDTIESEAVEQLKKLFGCEHAYVQPHSGADANLIAFWAILQERVEKPFTTALGAKTLYDIPKEKWEELRKAFGNQRLLGLDYFSGGHLTHGYRYNLSAKMFDVYSYAVSKATGLIDYEALEKQALEVKPLILLAGYSAYPDKINFKRMREIADKCGAVLMCDMAHFAGLVAGKVFTGDFSPFPHAHVVTTTTHKTLRGPRGGVVMCTSEFAEAVDKGCPLVAGGPLPHVMAAKALAFTEANKPEFSKYAAKIVENSKALVKALMARGLKVVTGNTENHLLLVDVNAIGLTGRQAESALRECNITLNRNSLPYDVNGAWYTSGLRMGTPAVTTLGMGTAEMEKIADIVKLVLTNTKPAESGKNDGLMSKAKYIIDAKAKEQAVKLTAELISKFPVYPELDLEFLKKAFI